MNNKNKKLLEYTKAQNLTAPRKNFIDMYREEILKPYEGDAKEIAQLAKNYSAMLNHFDFFAKIEEAAHAAAVRYSKQNEDTARLEGYIQCLKDNQIEIKV